ncbi:MAG: 3-deoxy-D-manno-octulosonic acid transferase [Candidatus Eiseniibacteriota bacterium]
MSVAWTLYRMLAPLAGALAPAAQVFAPPLERTRWDDRMGKGPDLGGCEAWIHAASLGESAAVRPLVRELRALDSECRLMFTTSTRTGRERLLADLEPVSLAPIDAPQAVRRFLARVRPARLLVIETELWPHWLLAARATAIPVAFVSARLSERSALGYRRLGRPLRELLNGVDAVLTQGGEDAARWASVGVRESRIAVCGNLKFDALPEPVGDAERERHRAALGFDPKRPLITLGSLRPGEAGPLARAWLALSSARREAWQVAAVPRHAAALAQLQAEARASGLEIPAGTANTGAWHWDARPGVLMAYYAASEAAFVGASLVPLGGHNPLEPAALGAAVLCGPEMSHQRQAVEALKREGGIEIAGADRLSGALALLTGETGERERRRLGALRAVATLRGGARRTVSELARRSLWPVQP